MVQGYGWHNGSKVAIVNVVHAAGVVQAQVLHQTAGKYWVNLYELNQITWSI